MKTTKFHALCTIFTLLFCSSANSAKYTTQSAVNYNLTCKPDFIGGVKESSNDLVAIKFTDSLAIKIIHISKFPINALTGFKSQSLQEGFSDNNDGLRMYTEKLLAKIGDNGHESNSYFILTPFMHPDNFPKYLSGCHVGTMNKKTTSVECNGDIDRSFRYLASTGRFQYSEVGNWVYHDKDSAKNPKAVWLPSYFVYGHCERDVD